MTLRTLDDVRKLMRHLPRIGADLASFVAALRRVLMLEHIECRLR